MIVKFLVRTCFPQPHRHHPYHHRYLRHLCARPLIPEPSYRDPFTGVKQ